MSFEPSYHHPCHSVSIHQLAMQRQHSLTACMMPDKLPLCSICTKQHIYKPAACKLTSCGFILPRKHMINMPNLSADFITPIMMQIGPGRNRCKYNKGDCAPHSKLSLLVQNEVSLQYETGGKPAIRRLCKRSCQAAVNWPDR